MPLGFTPYGYQRIAHQRLDSGAAHGGRSTIVATGAGCRKTECFLWPILDHCRCHAGEEGVKTIRGGRVRPSTSSLRPAKRRTRGGVANSRTFGKAAKRAAGKASASGEQGIEHERQMLRRLALVRFGAATGDRLAAAIGAEADPQRLMDVAEVIVRCTTGRELLREAGASG